MSPTPSLRSVASIRNNVFPSFSGAMIVDGESGIRIQGHIPDASQYRDEIRTSNFGDGSVGYSNAIIPPDPPSYDDIISPSSSNTTIPGAGSEPNTSSQRGSNRDGGLKLPPPRFRISPRPEEGNEDLPAYTKSIYKETLLAYKPELSSPFDRAIKRKWKQAFVVLNGTALYLHKNKSAGFFSAAVYAEEGNLDQEASLGFKAGSLISKYTLQGAEVGMATDYQKRHYVIRLRAETEQFLLSFRKLEHMIEWIESISAAIDLSPSLDERSLPRYQTMPRRQRPATIQTPAQLVQEQQTIIRSQFPHLSTGNNNLHRLPSNLPDVPEENEAPSAEGANTTPRPIGSSAPVNRRRNPQSRSASTIGNVNSFANPLMQSSPRPRRSSISSAHSDDIDLDALRSPGLTPTQSRASFSSAFRRNNEPTPTDQKIPLQRISDQANLRYARRCMAVLCADAPRQSNYVIYKGEWVKIEWEGRRLVRIGTGETVGGDLPPYTKRADEGLA